MTLYRGMDRAALDANYNNTAAVKNSADLLAKWRGESAVVRAERPEHLDLVYGPAPRQKIDLFLADNPKAPTLAFIHGGYWQRNDKEWFANMALGLLSHGFNVANIGYSLAPTVRLTAIVGEIRAAIDWLAAHLGDYGADPAKLYVSGWSAGGHLTAGAMDHPAVRGGLAISGIFDLEPMRLCHVNDKVHMDEAEVAALSPMFHLPKQAGTLLVTVGGAELAELQRQSADYLAAWQAAGLNGRSFPMPGHDHFSIMEELASPTGRMCLELVNLMRG